MKLILTGGGDETKSKGTESLFVENLINDKVLYIPVAMEEERIPYPDCYEWCKSNLSQYGNFAIDMWIEEDLYEHEYSDITEYGGVFIGGGNTFHLLNEFRKSGFGEDIMKLLAETEIPVIGGSAGAVIFAESIATANPYDKNHLDLRDLDGYGLTMGFDLWPHYEESMDELIHEYVEKLDTRIIAIPENSGVYYENDAAVCTGKGDVKIFPDEIVVEEGEEIPEAFE